MRQAAFDWPLFLLGVLLTSSGLVYIYSATWQAATPPGPYLSSLVIKQGVSFILALAMFFIVRRINWGLKPGHWLWYFIPVIALLITVLIIGHGPEEGVKRWINFGPLDLQPSEFAKLAFILILAWLYSDEKPRLKQNYIVALGVLAVLMALVLKQPDLGTGMVFAFIFFVMSAFSLVPRRWLIYTLLACVLLAVPAWFMLHTYQKNRVLAFMGYELVEQEDGSTSLEAAHNLGATYQVNQSLIAIGSGGLSGKGFLQGTQVRGGFIPVVESDFIFALVGEEFGLLGGLYLIALFFLLLARIMVLAYEARTAYERYLCYGTSAVIFFHVFINIGMTIKLAPVTGVPLPFISSGGSSLMTFWLMLAINMAVFANTRRDRRSFKPRR
jgi:rod shape determining protein RodA